MITEPWAKAVGSDDISADIMEGHAFRPEPVFKNINKYSARRKDCTNLHASA